MNSKVLLIGLAVGSSFCGSVFADVNWEVSGGVSLEKDAPETDLFGLALTRYLSPLEHRSDAPYSETEFVNRIGELAFGVSRIEESRGFSGFDPDSDSPDWVPVPGTSTAPKIDGYLYGINYVRRQAGSDNVFRAGYRRTDMDVRGLNIIAADDTSNELSLGYDRYLSEHSSVGVKVSFDRNKSMTSSSVTREPFFETESRIESDTFEVGLSGRQLFELGNDTWFALSGELGYREIDIEVYSLISADPPRVPPLEPFADSASADMVTGELVGTYYLNQKIAVLGGLGFADSDFGDSTVIQLGLEVFVSETVKLEAGYFRTDTSGSSWSTDRFVFGGGFRF